MFKRACWLILFLNCFISSKVCGQQDVDFHLITHLFTGKNIIKVKRDYFDPYLWAISQNNEVYRINSITLNVDDYSAAFTAYNTLQFVDIAGVSQNRVFIATNSSTVLELNNGTLTAIGQAQGLSGNVSQIGFEQIYSSGLLSTAQQLLMIATTTDIFYYDCTKETIANHTTPAANNQLFETTYRTEAYSNLGFNYFDPVLQYSTINKPGFTIYQGALLYNTPVFGYHINTAYYITGSYLSESSDYQNTLFMSQLWGTETGLFQNNWDYSYYLTSPYSHYLSGIKVNKITSIYGLTSFVSLTRENLLVGTDKGLYFSNSSYEKYIQGPMVNFNTFTIDNDIGNKVINDVCVDATSYSPTVTICEDAAWVAAVDGLYLIKPDYSKYTSTSTVNTIGFQNNQDNVSTISICSGSSVSMLVNNSVYTGNSIQWYKDGAELAGESNGTLTVTAAGDYYAKIYDPCSNYGASSNHLTVTIVSGPVFTFTYPAVISNCNSNPVTLQITDNSVTDLYRWYQDGVLNGNTTATQTVTQSGKYYAEISGCSGTWVATQMVEVDLVNLPVPSITGDKTTYCQGDGATLSDNVPIDPSYTINWYLNNVLLTADNNLPQITTTTAGNYSVTISSNISTCTSQSVAYPLSFTPPPTFTFDYPSTLNYCAGNTVTLKVQGSPTYQYEWFKEDNPIEGATSNELTVSQNGSYSVQVSSCPGNWVPGPNAVQVNFIATPIPVIITDKPAYCQGDNAILSVNDASDPTLTVYWYKDNIRLTGDDGDPSISTNAAGTYTASIVSSYTDPNGTPCSSTSAPVTISFDAPQQVTIQETADNGLCAGQSIALKAIYTGGSVQWSTGETSDQITVTISGTYSVTLTTPSGCQTNKDIDIAFLPDPVLAQINDTPLCVYKKETVTLTAPPGFAQYNWNNQNGGQTYTVSQPQTVNLIVTDANGCQASEKINVYAQCPDVEIPNTFTPNGDNINDTWVIEGLDNTATVNIFTRYGTQIYKSTGYTAPWDGTYNGKKVASGAYYYIITNKSGKEKYSGFVMVVY